MVKVQPLMNMDWNLLFSAVTVFVLFLILKHFFFEKVHQFMVDRENAVRDSLDHADEVNRQADEKLKRYSEQIAGAEAECRQLIKAARDEAKSQAAEIVQNADEEARALLEHSQKEIRREQYNARKELREEVGSLAVLAAEQILEKELSENDHKEIINKVIEKAEDEPWS